MTPRLMFVHAHPDDESSKGAGTAARYVDAGAEVVLVTCTGGEAGDVLNPAAPPIPPERMAEVRAAELADAVRAIGFTRTHLLGFVDSGYHEDPAALADGCFARWPLDDAARRLAAILRTERPHVVVTYPQDGGYPHPDHIRTHAVTMRAIDLAADDVALEGTDASPWRVPKVYSTVTWPNERIRALLPALVERGLGDDPFLERLRERAARQEDTAPDARIDVGAHLDRRDAALRAHVTQVDPEGHWFRIPRDLERERYPYEGYTLEHSEVTTSPPEDDLFAGIDLAAWDGTASAAPSGTR